MLQPPSMVLLNATDNIALMTEAVSTSEMSVYKE
jgi:hypothetical protein